MVLVNEKMHFGEETAMKLSGLLGTSSGEPLFGLASEPAARVPVSGRESQEGDGRLCPHGRAVTHVGRAELTPRAGGPGIRVIQLCWDSASLGTGYVGGPAGLVFQEARLAGGQTKDTGAGTPPMDVPTRQA